MKCDIRLRRLAGEWRFITVLPPGAARFALHLRNHGHDEIPYEVTCWPRVAIKGKMTTGGPWRDWADRSPIENGMIFSIEHPDAATRIRLRWLAQQRYGALQAFDQARRVLFWLESKGKVKWADRCRTCGAWIDDWGGRFHCASHKFLEKG